MRLFKKCKRKGAWTEHVHEILRNRLGRPVQALIRSYPVRRFDPRYRSDLADETTVIYEDSEGRPISKRKFMRKIRHKLKRLK